MSVKVLLAVCRIAKEIALIVLAAISFIVLVSDVAEDLVLWKVSLLKGAAFAVLLVVFLLTSRRQRNIRELKGADRF